MTNNTVGVWLREDGTVGRPDPSSLYRYCGNDPTNATDPSGLAEKTLSVEKAIAAIAKDLWEKTVKDKKEHGGVIIKDKKGNIKLRNERRGSAHEVEMNLDVDRDEAIIATIHTHPNGPTAFSAQDILFALRFAKKVERDFVVTKGTLYMLLVDDGKLAQESYENRRKLHLQNRYTEVIWDETEKNDQKRSEKAVQAMIKDTGLYFYKGDDSYREVKLYK